MKKIMKLSFILVLALSVTLLTGCKKKLIMIDDELGCGATLSYSPNDGFYIESVDKPEGGSIEVNMINTKSNLHMDIYFNDTYSDYFEESKEMHREDDNFRELNFNGNKGFSYSQLSLYNMFIYIPGENAKENDYAPGYELYICFEANDTTKGTDPAVSFEDEIIQKFLGTLKTRLVK